MPLAKRMFHGTDKPSALRPTFFFSWPLLFTLPDPHSSNSQKLAPQSESLTSSSQTGVCTLPKPALYTLRALPFTDNSLLTLLAHSMFVLGPITQTSRTLTLHSLRPHSSKPSSLLEFFYAPHILTPHYVSSPLILLDPSLHSPTAPP